MADVLGFITDQAWQYKRQGNQYLIQQCPLCGKKNHFYINQESGAWDCKSCQAKGSLFSLKQRLGAGTQIAPMVPRKPVPVISDQHVEQCHFDLLNNPDALAYLKSRGLDMITLEHFKVGYVHEHGKGWLVIPHYQDGKVVNLKYRSLPPDEKEFRRYQGGASVIFNGDAIKGASRVHFCEGEIDTMTAWQHGVECPIGGTLGTGGLAPEWFDLLAHVTEIVLLQDGDSAGQKGAEAMAKRLGLDRCLNVVIPDGGDVNSYFQTFGIGEFNLLPRNPYPVKNVMPFGEALYRLSQRGDSTGATGLKTPWTSVDKLIGPMSAGDLIVVSGTPGTGKTTWCLQIAWSLALQNKPVLVYCLEMRPERLALKVVQAYFGLTEEQVTPEKLGEASLIFEDLPLYFGHNFDKPKADEVMDTIKEAQSRFNLHLVVFDNLHFLCRELKYVVQEVGNVTRSFKLLAESLEIPIMLIAQPRKVGDKMMTLDDLKDSSSIGADADSAIIIHRKPVRGQDGQLAEQSLDPKTLIRLEKNRYRKGGELFLHYDGAKSRFGELAAGY